MNPRVRALGETVLRVKDLDTVKRFYTDVIGLDVLREFEGITFLIVPRWNARAVANAIPSARVVTIDGPHLALYANATAAAAVIADFMRQQASA
jgi:catechol-2,3-dioxygenase